MTLPATTGAAQPPAKAQPKSVLVAMATRYNMEPAAFEQTLRGTVFPTGTREEFAAFLVVAHEYRLNPITRQIYAFPKKGGGIVPVVGIDGWIHLVNSHPQFDGMDFEFENDDQGRLVSCTCRIYRKDRTKPVVVTEYLEECVRQTDPWKMKRRMLRHKTLIQGARYAFGFSGIHDDDEAHDIANDPDAPVPMPPPPPPADTKQIEAPAVGKPAEKVEDAQIIEASDAADTGDDAAVEPFDAEAWLDDAATQFAACKTPQDVDEAHEVFSDTMETMLTREQRERYQAIHLAAAERLEQAAAAGAIEEPAPQASTPPAAVEKPALTTASSLDDDEDETKVLNKGDLYVARGDAVLQDPARTRASIAEFWVSTKDERLALKKAGLLSAEAATALNARLKAVDAELAAAEQADDDDEAPEPAAPPAGDDPISKFDREYRAKIASIQSVTELHQYVESTLPTRNALGVDQAQITKWREVKVLRQNQLNGIG